MNVSGIKSNKNAKSNSSMSGKNVITLKADAVVIGSGCAGFNAADWLFDFGMRNILLVTEGINMGTSRNTGSDKQTYYKLSLASDGEDSVTKLAEDLFAGSGVNGDNAYAEASCSVRSFIKLANLGVPFPTNEFGEYVGYKTDHDPRQRATSAGPLTSRFMTEALERQIRSKGIPVLNNTLAVELIVEKNMVKGVICLDLDALNNGGFGLVVIRADNVILATGGPAACYLNSVYPQSQTGMSGMALRAGAKAANLQEWQYGLASIKFRWNVSGTYQQVLPRYISIDENGTEHEFLPDYFDDPAQALDMVFLKGYQWPFDTEKVEGSSIIDLIVHHEIFGLNRRVYMDFTKDPLGLYDDNGAPLFDTLSPETHDYLKKSGALLKTPIARLAHMNTPAIELYKNNGIDLYNEPLEVSVCAQHHNGGIAVDANWCSSVSGLYAAGEAAGTFGIRRPGGSALNSAQVGALRAAEHISLKYKNKQEPSSATEGFDELAFSYLEELVTGFESMLKAHKERCDSVSGDYSKSADSLETCPAKSADTPTKRSAKEMSLFASHVRDISKMKELSDWLTCEIAGYFENSIARSVADLPRLLKDRDTLITQLAVLSAMVLAAETVATQGSALILKQTNDLKSSPQFNNAQHCDTQQHGTQQANTPINKLPGFDYDKNKPLTDNMLVLTEKSGELSNLKFISKYVPVRPLPKPNGWFENVWSEYRRLRGF